jgi:hypothetical protein
MYARQLVIHMLISLVAGEFAKRNMLLKTRRSRAIFFVCITQVCEHSHRPHETFCGVCFCWITVLQQAGISVVGAGLKEAFW